MILLLSIKLDKGVFNMKRFLVSLLICAICLGAVSPAISFAADSVVIAATNVEAKPNKEFEVPFTFSEVKVGAFHLEVTFDATLFDYVKCDLSDEFSALVAEGEAIFAINPNDSKNGKLIIGGAVTKGAVLTSPFSIVLKAKDITSATTSNVDVNVVRLVDAEDNALTASATSGVVSVVVVPLTDIIFAVENKFLETGDSFIPEYTFAPSDYTDTFVPTWTSGDPEIATVDEEGKVTAVRAGSTTITLTCGKISKSFNITVTAIEAPSEAVEINAGETATLALTVLPEETPLTYEWRSLNEEIASVENGVVTGVAEGSTQIAVLVVETGKTYYFDVNVKIPYMKGDFDGDKKITVADALAALRIAAKMVECTDTDILIGDIDADKTITVADSLAILRVAAKMSDTL